jgi:hypothetical protein
MVPDPPPPLGFHYRLEHMAKAVDSMLDRVMVDQSCGVHGKSLVAGGEKTTAHGSGGYDVIHLDPTMNLAAR